MTHYETLSLVIGGGTLSLTIVGLALGLIVRITRRWTQVEGRLDALVEKITEAINSSHEDYASLERRIERTEDRVNRHEQYHAEMLGARPGP